MKNKFDITGMSCAACSANIEKKVGKISGVSEASVSLLQNSMEVEYDEKAASADEIMRTVQAIGYGATLKGEAGKTKESKADMEENEATKVRFRLVWSIILLVPLMYIAMGHMMGLPLPEFLSGMENAVSFALAQMLITIPIMYLNRKFFEVGFKALWQRVPNMDSLVAVGAMAAFVYGAFAIFRMSYGLGQGDMDLIMMYQSDLYFESAGVILTLITVGKYLEARSKGKTSRAIEKLMDLTPDTAIVLINGEEKLVATADLQKGDIVVIKQGMKVPVDGIVQSGSGLIDESAITGESVPVSKTKGDRITSATIQNSGYLTFMADKVGEDTTLSQIIKLVEEAASSKAPISKMVDKVSGVFVPVVMIIALITGIIWMLMGKGFEFALARTITILVISCPCALGLATPTAIMVGTGHGAGRGILIKSAESLEHLGKIKTMVFDKTGTLTEGKPAVTDVIFNIDNEDKILEAVCAIEEKSEHPLSIAIVNYGREKGLEFGEAKDFEAIPGEGIIGEVDGQKYLCGNQKMMENMNINIGDKIETLEKLSIEGKTVLLVANESLCLGMVAVADQIKENSRAAVDELNKLGIESVMLTGDNQVTANAVKDQIGIKRAIAEVLPQDKEKHIREFKDKGDMVAMVGDGINDAPALTRADVGIAISAGTDVAIEAADIVLVKNDVLDAVTAIKLSRAVVRNIKQNLFWAFFYNVLGIPLAAGLLYPAFGITLNPMVGAAAMSLSSLFVVSNALRIRFFKDGISRPMIDSVKVDNVKEEEIMKKTMNIEGMMCTHCQGSVEKALYNLGVEGVVDLEAKTATVTMTKEVSDDELIKAVTDAGYEVKSVK